MGGMGNLGPMRSSPMFSRLALASLYAFCTASGQAHARVQGQGHGQGRPTALALVFACACAWPRPRCTFSVQRGRRAGAGVAWGAGERAGQSAQAGGRGSESWPAAQLQAHNHGLVLAPGRGGESGAAVFACGCGHHSSGHRVAVLQLSRPGACSTQSARHPGGAAGQGRTYGSTAAPTVLASALPAVRRAASWSAPPAARAAPPRTRPSPPAAAPSGPPRCPAGSGQGPPGGRVGR